MNEKGKRPEIKTNLGPAVEEWLSRRPAEDEVRFIASPLKDEVNKVIEVESEISKWDALEHVSRRFNELTGILEKHFSDPSFNISERSTENADNVLSHLETIDSTIDAVSAEIEGYSQNLGHLITRLLSYSVEALKDKAEGLKIAVKNIKSALENNVPYGDEVKAFQQTKKEFLSYTKMVFGDLEKGLDLMVRDPFLKQQVLNFEADVSDVILNGLKIPACIESAFAVYLSHRKQGATELNVFNSMYESKFKKDFEAEKEIIEKDLEAKKQDADRKVQRWQNREDAPYYRELVFKNQAYWQQMTPEKLYEERLRFKAFELLLSSAGEKRVSPEVMNDLYNDWKDYKAQSTLN